MEHTPRQSSFQRKLPSDMEHSLVVILDKGPFLVPIIVILGSVFLISRLYTNYADLPLVGKEFGNSEKRRKAFLKGAAQLYQQGYDTFKNKPFRLTTADGERVVVPNSALEELRRLPDDHIDNRKAQYKSIEHRYTGLGGDADLLNHAIRADLTRSLNRINPRLAEEVAKTVDGELGMCGDWTPMPIYQKLLRIVAIVSGHVFLGPELCRREEYFYASINYTVDVFAAVRQLKTWNYLLRPIGQYFVPELKKIGEHRQKARDFLVPIIKEREAAMEKGEPMPDDMLQWMINKRNDFNVSDEDLADTQLTLSLAAIHTTTLMATDVLCELVVRPEVVEEVRNEIECVLQQNEGIITTRALFDMKLLDSVMREAQRLAPFNQARFPRYVSKPVTLSNGQHIPAGCMIETPHGPVTQDAKIYPNPETFDAHRFVDLRNYKVDDPINYKNREQYQFVSVTKENMGFGYGAHACPGRFFAANEIKLIVARLLLQYDIRLPDGAQLPPKNVMGAVLLPRAKLQIELRKVKSTAA